MTDSEREALAERMEVLAAQVSVAFLDLTIELAGRMDFAAASFVEGERGEYASGLLDFARRIREGDFKPAQVYR